MDYFHVITNAATGETIQVPMTPEEIAAMQPTQEEIISDYESALDDFLDSVAQRYRFENRLSLSLRAAYPNAWQQLAIEYGEWMDGCNVQAYQLLQDVIDGKKPMPTIDEFLGGLPAFGE